jgi:DNA-binding transcriptional LysR family regulator
MTMNLRSLDLNLLVALEALLAERHVTRAANRIGLSQPAMSNALSRLRRIFRDDLLVRTALGMQPTAQAELLREPLRIVLRQIERVLEGSALFDPQRAKITLVLRLSDLLAYQILPPLLASIVGSAPGVSLDIVHLSPTETVDALERDEVHAGISMSLEHSTSIRSEALLRDRMVCVMRRGHPLGRGRLTLDAFFYSRHLKVSMSPTDRRFVDDILRESGQTRDVAVNVPHWLLVPHLLRSTDLISVMPERFAASISGDLVCKALPFASAPFEWRLYRHRRHDGSRAVDWLCQRLREVAAALA